jgi:hypothetical protein
VAGVAVVMGSLGVFRDWLELPEVLSFTRYWSSLLINGSLLMGI